MSVEDKQRELQELRAKVRDLEDELAAERRSDSQWRATGYYTAYHATAGFMLGALGALASLAFNVVGSLLFGKHPLELIRVYLTFPMGAEALDFNAVDNGIVLAVGVCLYVATGMLYGIVFQLVLTRFVAEASFPVRLAVVSALSIVIWLVNFYGILSWLQPLLFGGNWIVEQVPPVVAALTHLVFGWTMLLVSGLGRYTPYRLQTERS